MEAGEEPIGLAQYSHLRIETDVDPEELRARLGEWAPWRYAVEFSNGVDTTEFERGEFFVEEPLAKFQQFGAHLPAGLAGGEALDIGCGIGHNSIHLRRHYKMNVTGVDARPANVDIARYLVEIGGIDNVRFQLGDAARFISDQRFDLILHLTTLTFMRDPFQALRNAVQMLRPGGGCLVLEHRRYRDPEGDDTLCKFHPHLGPDDRDKPWWSLGSSAVENMLWNAGCGRVEIVSEWEYEDRLWSTFYVAYRT
jgi:2-polyprenyl-3-methyl-5-hydroxy-6-metoxy-1,4-benzoquinol methylase